MPSSEARVVYELKQHLSEHGLFGESVDNIVVDAHGSYRGSRYASKLEPLARIDIEGAFPDLVCLTGASGRAYLTAFEVKPDARDWVKGMGQAELYRSGVHQSYLAMPMSPDRLEYRVREHAHRAGIGVLVLHEGKWSRPVEPRRPTPAPDVLESTLAILDGARLRTFGLNHPLNYLVAAYTAGARRDGQTLLEALSERYPDLRSDSTRQQAIAGARTMGLLGEDDRLTREGDAIVDLMRSVGFDIGVRVDKRRRLADIEPALAAIARVTLLRQAPVRLICSTLDAAGGSSSFSELAFRAWQRSGSLARSVFLLDPSQELTPDLPGSAFRTTTPHQLKQTMWHAGLLSTKKHPTAGKGAAAFRAGEDIWTLAPR